MKRLLFIILLVGYLCGGKAMAADLSFKCDGQLYTPYPNAILKDGVTVVPVSVITDCLDIDAKANSKDGTITLIKNDSEVLVDAAKNQFIINNQVAAPVKAIITNEEHIYVPLRQVAEALGAQITWDGANYCVGISAPVDKNVLTIFHAGSLKAPMAELKTRFIKSHPRARIYLEPSGSLDCARKVSEQGRLADVVASADYAVFDQLMVPKYTEWYAMFARNEMVLCYTDKSKFGEEIKAENWPEILARSGVVYSHTNPDLDPAGYRALMVWQLAEKYYNKAGLYEKLIAGCPEEKVYDSASDLIAALKDGKLDYAFEYLSVAQQNSFKYVALPEAINLSSLKQAEFYKNAKVLTVDAAKGTKAEQTGQPIIYALTVPSNAPNRGLAMDFVKLVLSKEGQDIMSNAGQIPIVPPEFNNPARVPSELK